MTNLKEVYSNDDFNIAVTLFKECIDEINTDLSFQNFDQEIQEIHLQYSRPDGVLFLAYDNKEDIIGWFGIRKFSKTICELKRMYIRKEARSQEIGKYLISQGIPYAKGFGYGTIRLDTLPSMKAAIKLHIKLGFNGIEPYRFNPIKGSRFFEMELS